MGNFQHQDPDLPLLSGIQNQMFSRKIEGIPQEIMSTRGILAISTLTSEIIFTRTNGDQIPRVSNTNQVIVEAELIVGHREVLRLTLTLTVEGLLIAESIEKEEVHHPWKKAGKGKDLHLNQRLRDIAMRILIPEGRGASDASRVMILAETIIRCTKDPLMSVSLTIVGLLIAENIEKGVVHRIWKETGKRKGDLHLNLSIRVISTRTPIVSDASQVIVEANVMTVTLTMAGLLIAKSIEKREVHHPWRLVGVTRVDIF